MKKVKEAPVETKEETPQVLSYKEDLKEVKELLKRVASAIENLRLNGGFN
jgi:cell fate (sporulation/competence/biofilm development) regulator YmcA (YheA/YmcA/DUF963 family)